MKAKCGAIWRMKIPSKTKYKHQNSCLTVHMLSTAEFLHKKDMQNEKRMSINILSTTDYLQQTMKKCTENTTTLSS